MDATKEKKTKEEYEKKMYVVIDMINGESTHSKHDDFDEALSEAESLALEQAKASGIDPEVISTFENGTHGPWPAVGEGADRDWEAGAGPENDPCAYWPHVEWREGEW